MVLTPWGKGSELRERMMTSGPRSGPEAAARNQRERLYGAMVASCAARGYGATTVSELVGLSGVSRRDFYRHFADKRACFEATLEAIIEASVAYVARRVQEPGSWEERSRRGFDALARLVLAQPAAARLCLIEVYAAGPEAVARLEGPIGGFEALTAELLAASQERAGMPAQMIRAFVGAMEEIVRTRLRRGSEAELPALMGELWELMHGYRPPPEPLRRVSSRPARGGEELAGHDPAERALRAFTAVVAERGYGATRIAAVVGRAQMSASTFYAHFSDKRDALDAALAGGGAQLAAAVLPAARRAPDWAQGIRAGLGALFSYLAFRPALARLLAVEVYAAGSEAVARRNEAVAPLEALLAEGYGLSPETPAIAVEAIAGGVYALAYDQIRRHGPASLPALAPIATYIALAPFLGAAEACAVANGGGRGR
jgi:AcrR family transcriptional regulator